MGRVRVNVAVGEEKAGHRRHASAAGGRAQADDGRPRPRGGRHPLRQARHQGQRRPEDVEPARLRHRRRGGRAAVHPCRQLSCRHRHPPRAVPPARQGRHPHHPLGHLHRARAGARGPVGGRRPRSRQGTINVLRWPYHENDRAQAERETEGHIKVVTAKNGKILGATIVGAEAGELIQMWALAISQKMNIKAMIGWVSPYPTLSEINKRVAYRYYATAPSSPLVRWIIGFLAKFG